LSSFPLPLTPSLQGREEKIGKKLDSRLKISGMTKKETLSSFSHFPRPRRERTKVRVQTMRGNIPLITPKNQKTKRQKHKKAKTIEEEKASSSVDSR